MALSTAKVRSQIRLPRDQTGSIHVYLTRVSVRELPIGLSAQAILGRRWGCGRVEISLGAVLALVGQFLAKLENDYY